MQVGVFIFIDMSLFENLKNRIGFYKQIKKFYWSEFELCLYGEEYLNTKFNGRPDDSLFKPLEVNFSLNNEVRNQYDDLGAKPVLTQVVVKAIYDELIVKFPGIAQQLNEISTYKNSDSYYQNVQHVCILGRLPDSTDILYRLVSWYRRGTYIYLKFEALGYE